MEQVPPEFDLVPYCIDRKAMSVGSSVLGCQDSLYDGDPLLGFLTATEADIHQWVSTFYFDFPYLNDPSTYLLLNCERISGGAAVRDWHIYNDFPAIQNLIFDAVKLRIEIFRSYFPDAIISLGPSLSPHKKGQYIPVILERMEALIKAGLHGVFDSVTCFEPRLFINYGPNDGPQWMEWNLAMTQQGLDIGSFLVNSSYQHLPLCPITSYYKASENSPEVVDIEMAREQVELILSYPNVLTFSWWTGNFEQEQLSFMNDLNICDLLCGCEEPFGDINGDGLVGTQDLLSLFTHWGTCPGCPQDLDCNGAVSSSDLLILLSNWSPNSPL